MDYFCMNLYVFLETAQILTNFKDMQQHKHYVKCRRSDQLAANKLISWAVKRHPGNRAEARKMESRSFFKNRAKLNSQCFWPQQFSTR